ncbi:hypothetical protein LguiA_033819 [Lonicera macranthoides]
MGEDETDSTETPSKPWKVCAFAQPQMDKVAESTQQPAIADAHVIHPTSVIIAEINNDATIPQGRIHNNSLLLGSSSVAFALHYCKSLAHPTNSKLNSHGSVNRTMHTPTSNRSKKLWTVNSLMVLWFSALLEPLLNCRDLVVSPLNLPTEARRSIGLFRLNTGSDYTKISHRFQVKEPVRLEHILERIALISDAANTEKPSSVSSSLFIGGAMVARSVYTLQHLGIAHILCLCANEIGHSDSQYPELFDSINESALSTQCFSTWKTRPSSLMAFGETSSNLELACLGQHKPKAFTSTLLGQVRPRGISSDENTHVPGKYIKRFLHVPAPGVYREVLPNRREPEAFTLHYTCVAYRKSRDRTLLSFFINREEFVPHRALPYIYLPDIDKYGRRLTSLRRRNLQRDQLVVTFPGTSPMKSSSRGAIFPIFLQKSKDEFFKNRDKTGNLRSTLLPTLNSHWEFSQVVVDASLQTPEN